MATRMGNTEIESATAVTEGRPPAPPIARSGRIGLPALSGHQHQSEIGDGVRFILLRGPQKQEPGTAVVCRSPETVKAHKSQIKQSCRVTCARRLMVIGSCSNQILPHHASCVKHRTIIVGCSNMAGIGGTAHHVSATKKCVATSVRSDQGNCFLKQSHPIHHGTHFIVRPCLG